jgi:hypothetical protein
MYRTLYLQADSAQNPLTAKTFSSLGPLTDEDLSSSDQGNK